MLFTDTILCPYPDPPDNGSVIVGRFGYPLGRAYYSCNRGYRLSEYPVRTCQPSGSWSGTQPTCIRE